MALDLSPSSPPPPPPPDRPVDPTNTVRKKNQALECGEIRPKNTCNIVKRIRSNTDNSPLFLASAREDRPDWSRGSTLSAAAELAGSLHNECRKLFLSYVEKYLDEVDRKSSSTEYDSEMVGMMYKVKMVGDWLNVILDNKEGKEELVTCENLEEAEAYERVRNKIYGILLKHVERTAMAFRRVNGPF